MGLKYFNNKQWKDITREERYFCAELFNYIKSQKKEKEFVKWLREKTNNGEYDDQYEWEIAYEVCFYRDYLKEIKKYNVKNSKYPQKRTFDLCLFSEKRIIIIEAKAQQALDLTQLTYLKDDKKDENDIEMIKALLGETINISVILIASSHYINGSIKQGDRSRVKKCKEKGYEVISWDDINKEFIKDINYNKELKEIFERANAIYNK